MIYKQISHKAMVANALNAHQKTKPAIRFICEFPKNTVLRGINLEYPFVIALHLSRDLKVRLLLCIISFLTILN